MPLNNENDASKIKIRRDTAQNWAELNPILDEGEIGIEWTDDTKTVCNIKIGNGEDHFNDLNYFKGSLYNGEVSPLISYDELNDQTLPSINGVPVQGDLSLVQLGIQPIGSYASNETLINGLALKADKEDTYDKDEVDNLLDNIRELPDYSQEDGTYLKIVHGVPTYSTIDADVVSRATLDEELSKKVDKANGYSLVKDTEHQAMLDAIETLEGYDIPDIKEDVAFLQTEMDTKAEVGEALPEDRFLDKYLLRRDFDGALANYATIDALRTKANASDLTNHTQDFNNPHRVSLTQLGLSEDYTRYPSPELLPINVATQTALNNKADRFEIGYGLELENGTLTNTMPNVQTDWLAEEGSSEAAILNKPVFADVAFSGSYNDLSDTPEIEHYVLPEAQAEVLGGIKLGEDFELDEDGHLKYVTGIVDYNDLRNKPSFKDIDGTIYPLIPEMTAADLNLASLSVAKAIDTRLEEEKADKTEIARLDERIDNIPQVDNVYTKEECDAKFLTEHQDISGKADKATTLAGYGITDAYTKADMNNILLTKADKAQVNQQMANKQDLADKVNDVSGIEPISQEIKYPSVKAILVNNTALTTDYESKIGALRTETQTSITAINTNLAENYYDKDDIDSKMTSLFKYKGSVETMDDLPVSGNQVGDVWNVEYEEDETTGELVEWGMNVCWNGSEWDELGTGVDLSNYVQFEDIENLAEKATTLAGYGIIDAYTKTETDNLLAQKADKGTTLANYGITDAYTKTATDTAISNAVSSKAAQADLDALELVVNGKANANAVYTKTEADGLFETIANVALKADASALTAHTGNTNNPHQVTKAQVGLGNVDNTNDLDKPISTATQTALDGKQATLTTVQLNAVNSGITSGKVDTYDGYATTIDSKADSSTVTTLSNTVSQHTTQIASKADASNVYTKAEVDGKLSSSMHFKGTVATVADLPSSDQVVGDMYNVLANGANYAWDGSVWDKLSETIDLSVYYTKTETDNLLTPINTSITSLTNNKQDNLTQGDNITIVNNRISAVVPTNVSQLTNDSGYITSSALPTVNNATLTIQKNATTVDTFTANASADKTINISVPTTVAELTDSSDYALVSSLSNYALDTAVVHKNTAETINGIKTFNDGIVASRSSSGAIAKLTSEQGDTYFMVERTISGSDPIQAVVENGLTDTKIGTKSNNAVKIITNNTAQVTVGTDGSVVLATDVAANSNNNQVATTKWVNAALPTKVSDLTNDSGFISGITSSDVTTALGYTPYNSTNPNGYQANVIESIKVNGTAQTITSKAVNISVPTNNNQLTNGAGYITGINSSDVTTALGYTPYNSTNPSGYQTASDVSTAISGKADSATTLAGYGITDAYTKTQIDNKFQYVTEMPASPVEGVTYFILEDDEEEE